MGYKGELAHCFAVIMKELWTNKFAVLPTKFKSVVGKHHEQFRGNS